MIELYEHNKQAYENVLENFKTSNKTCVIQPTGTGKSFISLKWLYENKDKKCLFLTSNNIIVDQLIEYIEKSGLTINDFPNLEINTYHSLKDNNIKYDCIVLDEFHRCGAPEWGKEVRQVLDNNKEAKVLGISATPIRYLDNERDMSEELFDGNIASKMSLAQAVARGILPVPKYINCIYSFKEEIEEIQNKINKEKDETRKKELQKRLDDVKKELEKINGLADIFKKYLPNEKGKYVVFCKDKEHLEKMKEEAQNWFSEINNLNIFTITSDYEREVNKYTISRFENVKDDSIDLLFSIEMLNEGLHAKGIDGVIMLRPTYSPIIYFQQLGRALSTNAKQPIIFDIVNNSESFDSIYSFRLELEEEIEKLKAEYENEGKYEQIDELDNILNEFKIVDEYKDFMESLKSIHMDATFTWDSWHNLAKKYYEHHGSLDASINYKTKDGINSSEDGYKLGMWIYRQRTLKASNNLSENRIKQLEKIGMIWSVRENLWDTKYSLAKKYYEHYGHLNIPHEFKTINGIDYDEKGVALGYWLHSKRLRKDKLSSARIKQLESIGMVWDVYDNIWKKNYELVRKYYEHYGHLNIPNDFKTTNGVDYDEKGINISTWVGAQKYKKDQLTEDKIEQLEKIGIVWDVYEESWNTYYELAKKYYEINGNLRVPPDFEIEGKKLGSWIIRNRQNELSEEKINKLNEIGMIWDARQDSWDTNYALAKKYYEHYGHLNMKVKFKTSNGIDHDEKGVALGNWIFHLRQRKNELSEERIKQLENIGMIWDVYEESWDANYKLAKAFYEHNGHLRIRNDFISSDGIKYDEKGIKLGFWISDQRQALRKGNLQEEKIEKLNSIGMVWDLTEELWNMNYELAKKYYEHYGHLNILQKLKTSDGITHDENGLAIGTWITHQRKLKKIGELSEEKINKLENIGMIWNVKEDKLLTNPINKKTQEQVTEYLYDKLNSLLDGHYEFKTKEDIDILNQELSDSIYIAKRK